MLRPLRAHLKSGRRAGLGCLCLGFLLAFMPGVAYAQYTESTSAGPGTLSWTVTTSTQYCGLGNAYTATTYIYSGFTFTSGSSTQSLGGYARSVDSNCGIYGPTPGPQPSSITLSGGNFSITFYVGYDGFGSATYQQLPTSTTYTMYPAYKVLDVVYIPPGKGSYIGYTTSATNGATTTISSNVSSGTSLGFDASLCIGGCPGSGNSNGGKSGGPSAGLTFGWTTTSGNSVMTTSTIVGSETSQYNSASDPLDHTQDQIFIWINPAVTVSEQSGSFSYSLGGVWWDATGAPNQTPIMDIYNATVAQLQEPSKMLIGQLTSQSVGGVTLPGLFSICASARQTNPPQCKLQTDVPCGCVPSDFADIVQQDPFFHTGVSANATPAQVNQVLPNRFAYVNTELLDHFVKSSYVVDDKQETETSYTTTSQDSVSWSQSNNFTWKFTWPATFTVGWTNGNQFTWTDTMETTKTNSIDHTMQTALNPANGVSSACYTNADIYLDTVYHTYAFVTDSASPSACP